MVSRLDRLFILIDTGSSESIRLAAAKQLGEVQRAQPNDLNNLLLRVKEYSSKPVWETRVAAGHAIRCILEQVDAWPATKDIDCKDHNDQSSLAENLLEQNVDLSRIFQNFDLHQVLSKCPTLLSMNATSDIFDALDNNDSTSSRSTIGRGRGRKGSTTVNSRASRGRNARKEDREQLLRQRKLINKELGLGMVDSLNIGVKSTDIVSNDDLMETCDSVSANSSESFQQDARITFKQCICNYDETIRLLINKKCIKSSEDESSTEIVDSESLWPLQKITNDYLDDLLNPSWEIRHGAAIALREIIRLHGKSAGRIAGLSANANNILSQVWLIDLAMKVCCILALDKFGDFLFDQVVAPVRENAGQLLGCCVSHMSEKEASCTVDILLRMLNFPNWEARHGGILGLKYSFNVMKQSFVKQTLKSSFESVFKCLNDQVDDVSAEAAATLVSIKDLLIEAVPDKTPQLIKSLWDHIADLDEITTSTSSIVLLLASLITSSSTNINSAELIKSIPKLWPLLSHSSTSVRISVLKALVTLFKSQKTCCLDWMPQDLMTTTLRLVFQRSIIENMDEVSQYIEDTWKELIKVDNQDNLSQNERLNLLKSSSQYLNHWLCLTMQPSNVPIDRDPKLWLNIRSDGTMSDARPDGDVYIASSTFNAESMEQQKSQIIKCRLLGSRLLGRLYAQLVVDSAQSQTGNETLKYLSDMFIYYLKSKSANQRSVSGWILESWAHHLEILLSDRSKLADFLSDDLYAQVESAIRETSIYYDELMPKITRLQQDAREYVASLAPYNLPLDLPHPSDRRVIYNMSQLRYLCDLNFQEERNHKRLRTNEPSGHTLSPNSSQTDKALMDISNKQQNIRNSLDIADSAQKSLSITVSSSLACALIAWRRLPSDLGLLSSPLMKSIESESETVHQEKSACYLVKLFDSICDNMDGYGQVVDSLVNKLILILGPKFIDLRTLELDSLRKSSIITLSNIQRIAEQHRNARQTSDHNSSNFKRSIAINQNLNQVDNYPLYNPEGASLVLRELASHFGEDLPKKLPKLWSRIIVDISSLADTHLKSNKNVENYDRNKQLEDNLLLLETIGDKLSPNLRIQLLDLYPILIKLLVLPDPILRHQSAQCIAIISKMMFKETIESIKRCILPMLESNEDYCCYGAIEATTLIIEQLQLDLVPHINMFVVHVLKRMSAQDDQIRQLATHCFGKLLSLMPLNLSRNNPNHHNSSVDSAQATGKCENDTLANSDMSTEDEHDFIEQLLDPKKLKDSKIPFKLNAQLRSYQQEGLNWLDFLNRFNLHGILCDEMGLGKTLMTISMVALDHHRSIQSPDRRPISLIVCPATLMNHWHYEIRKFLPDQDAAVLKAASYSGTSHEKMLAQGSMAKFLQALKDKSPDQSPYNLIITSYDALKNEESCFSSLSWNYCVLDEGHMIKNGKTKLSKAVRKLAARHRLILSGTPIQNNVTELWSLFDFLMPGFLGSERQFQSRFARPIIQSREPKCSKREQEAGALAMESLHRQVLPFIMRRLKEDVLQDLPPKIIQDYYCELSPLQYKLYEDYTGSKLCKDVTKASVLDIENDKLEPDTKSKSKSHVFQALQYLRSVCNHPKLVLNEKHPRYKELKQTFAKDTNATFDDINHSSKLKALKQLLIDCGIGGIQMASDEPAGTNLQQQQQQVAQAAQQQMIESSVVKQHRALIFCQSRSMIDIVEKDLFKKHLPGITYLRLDGGVPTNSRQPIVNKFNDDPSVDVLLLTTQIGGLGLNLVGADTVIFVEHDWNPTKDLQAMDRAHRIGQKKVVNVYRLITKETLEEKIMGLQKFKTMVSNTVINQDNTSLGSMNVDQLFDLFECPTVDSNETNAKGKRRTNTIPISSGGYKSSFIDLLPELWDQQQYEMEYNLDNFVSSIKD